MSFRPDSPVELPNGSLVCGPHHLKVCGICTVDYSFMDEDVDLADEPVSDSEILEDSVDMIIPGAPRGPTVGTGRVLPTKFKPARTTDTPQTLFPAGYSTRAIPPVHRLIHASNPEQFLIFTDGACLNNGQRNPSAGCSFVYRPSTDGPRVPWHVDLRLENKGPTGEVHQKTSNRAELRAVIAALRYRDWSGEGCNSLVIATDSEYVVEGATSWVRGWMRRGWKTKIRAPVKNRDLWECLLGEVEKHHDWGMKIKFWRIPREWNTEADRHAKQAASGQAPEKFTDILGFLL